MSVLEGATVLLKPTTETAILFITKGGGSNAKINNNKKMDFPSNKLSYHPPGLPSTFFCLADTITQFKVPCFICRLIEG